MDEDYRDGFEDMFYAMAESNLEKDSDVNIADYWDDFLEEYGDDWDRQDILDYLYENELITDEQYEEYSES